MSMCSGYKLGMQEQTETGFFSSWEKIAHLRLRSRKPSLKPRNYPGANCRPGYIMIFRISESFPSDTSEE